MEKKDFPPPPAYDDVITEQPQPSCPSVSPSPPVYAKDPQSSSDGGIFTVLPQLQDNNFMARPEIREYGEPKKDEDENKNGRGCCCDDGKTNRNDCCMDACECCFCCCQVFYICAICFQACAH
ncbi:unnamed protein product [Bursaphelenchus xylophilus]|uniref:(pine wood nematode) hypothetical protein n=1 Tax=Bursaphelenchus xylophilus TaxID=6326 RepID=A0A1I7RXL6_BURXY|nr:unnamed protein product [Bursaphelenchus xylophilus]CAG9126559.1 unnamed protein product [Bursaphelenchus xylophilus]